MVSVIFNHNMWNFITKFGKNKSCTTPKVTPNNTLLRCSDLKHSKELNIIMRKQFPVVNRTVQVQYTERSSELFGRLRLEFSWTVFVIDPFIVLSMVVFMKNLLTLYNVHYYINVNLTLSCDKAAMYPNRSSATVIINLQPFGLPRPWTIMADLR